VLLHADLGGEHILWDADRGVIGGVIDWGDAKVGNPALDFTGLLDDFGPRFLKEVLGSYEGPADEGLLERTSFYAQLIPVYEILFGLEMRIEVHVKEGLERLG
jgi:aminoglycoside 2''-phosphotransferase